MVGIDRMKGLCTVPLLTSSNLLTCRCKKYQGNLQKECRRWGPCFNSTCKGYDAIYSVSSFVTRLISDRL